MARTMSDKELERLRGLASLPFTIKLVAELDAEIAAHDSTEQTIRANERERCAKVAKEAEHFIYCNHVECQCGQIAAAMRRGPETGAASNAQAPDKPRFRIGGNVEWWHERIDSQRKQETVQPEKGPKRSEE